MLYFFADLILLLGVRVLARRLQPHPKSFWYEVSEIVPLVFLLHLYLLVFEYPISVRLESVGLEKLIWLPFAAFLIVFAGWLFRAAKEHT